MKKSIHKKRLFAGLASISLLMFSGVFVSGVLKNTNSQDNINRNATTSDSQVVSFQLGSETSGVVVDNSVTGSQEIWMWGNNDQGQLGNGTTEDQYIPTQVDTSQMLNEPGDSIIYFALGENHSGTVVQNPDGSQEIWMWGDNNQGQLGNGTTDDQYVPTQVDTSQMLNDIGDTILYFDLGYEYSGAVVLDATGTEQIWMWGNNFYGQLGNGTSDSSNLPTQVDTSQMLSDSNENIIDFELGNQFASVLIDTNSDGNGEEIWTWGENSYGQLGNNTHNDSYYPVQVNTSEMLNETGDSIVYLASGVKNAGAVVQNPDGSQEIWMWGDNTFGQLGTGDNMIYYSPVQTNTTEMLNEVGDQIISFEIGENFAGTLIQNPDGSQEIWMWGDNTYGQFGNGTITSSYSPIMIDTSIFINEAGDIIMDFKLGDNYSGVWVQNPDGSQEIWMWGDNAFGQLGNGTQNNSYLPSETIIYTFYWVETPYYDSQSQTISGSFNVNYDNGNTDITLVQYDQNYTNSVNYVISYDSTAGNYNFSISTISDTSTNQYYYYNEVFEIYDNNGNLIGVEYVPITNIDIYNTMDLTVNYDEGNNVANVSFQYNQETIDLLYSYGLNFVIELVNTDTGKITYYSILQEDIINGSFQITNLDADSNYQVNIYLYDEYQHFYLNDSANFTTIIEEVYYAWIAPVVIFSLIVLWSIGWYLLVKWNKNKAKKQLEEKPDYKSDSDKKNNKESEKEQKQITSDSLVKKSSKSKK